jgi:hypothetical protein
MRSTATPLLLSSTLLIALLSVAPAKAQCGPGEVEVMIEVTTDDFGYETYWQLTASADPCGVNVIVDGGNPTMDCNSGGLQIQEMSGYGNNITYAEGPWCLIDGASYTIWSVDDWGDGHPTYEVFVNGISTITFSGSTGPSVALTFVAQLPQARDMSVTDLTTPLYSAVGEDVRVSGTVTSFGMDEVTSFDLNYRLNGGTAVTTNITGVSLMASDAYEFSHAAPWVPAATGLYTLEVWASNINGLEDLFTGNDIREAGLKVNDAIPNIIDNILGSSYSVQSIANSDQDLLVPRDLDFHPDLSRNELWVINKDTEASGGSTVKITNVGEGDMNWLMQEDPNNWHFMSLPTSIAFGNNGNFATTPGVFDANHNGGDPFTGPALWSSDPAIYAQPIFGGLGSHLDMLHVTPNAQGIAAETWNRFWVVDGFNDDVVMHDFRGDHGPGNDYHGNAIIRRYDDIQITRDPNDHIVSHCAMDKATGWLYVVDHGGQRVYRLNTATGTVSGPGDYGPWETYVEYTMVTGYAKQVIITNGLVEPAGIAVIGDRLLVSDHANGDIIAYDISNPAVPELGRIQTNIPGIMGITVGPDGRIWAVNATTHQLLVVEAGPVQVQERAQADWQISPSLTSGLIKLLGNHAFSANDAVQVMDAQGRIVMTFGVQELLMGSDLSGLANGAYMVRISGQVRRVVLEH